jgi:hypothetical protein
MCLQDGKFQGVKSVRACVYVTDIYRVNGASLHEGAGSASLASARMGDLSVYKLYHQLHSCCHRHFDSDRQLPVSSSYTLSFCMAGKHSGRAPAAACKPST